MSRRSGNAPVSPTGKTSKLTFNQSINQSTAMSALYITALLFVNVALFIHLLWDSIFVQSVNQSINQSLGFSYFSPSIDAFLPSSTDHQTNLITPNVDNKPLSFESMQGIAQATWNVPSPIDPSINIHVTDAELLAESLAQSTKESINSTANLIPNIAHFVIGATHTSRNGYAHSEPTFTMINYLSIKSAFDLGGFESIACHVLNEPLDSVYWDMARRYCTFIELLDLNMDFVFGRPVHHASIKEEIVRLRVLLQYGGHGIQDDVIFVNSLAEHQHEWMNHELVLGYTQPSHENWPDRPDVCIISAKASSLMLSEWFETFRMYEDASLYSEDVNIYVPDIERWTHDLAHSLFVSRRHLVVPAPVEWWGKIYAREQQGQVKLYEENISIDQLNPSTIAIHLWQSERISIHEQQSVDGSLLVTSVEPLNVPQIQSFAQICEMTNLYGQVLKKAMLAGTSHSHTC